MIMMRINNPSEDTGIDFMLLKNEMENGKWKMENGCESEDFTYELE